MIAEIVGIDTSSRILLPTEDSGDAAINFFQIGLALNAPGLGAVFALLAGEPKGVPGDSAGGGTGVGVPA
jgi:hypothetical protein